MAELERLLDAYEVANAFGVRRATIYQWARHGLLPSVKIGGAVRFRVCDLERLVSEKRENGNGQADRN